MQDAQSIGPQSGGTTEQIPPGGASDSHRHTLASLLAKGQHKPLLIDTFANLPAGSPALDGTIAFDTTNNRIVWYALGVRRATAAGGIV